MPVASSDSPLARFARRSCDLELEAERSCEHRAASRSREPGTSSELYDSPMPPRFTKDTLKFLRALKRNNDREWFRSRKDDYERHVRAPMIAVIEQLARDFQRFAPELVASPKASLYRIYRDTRFSEDKTPLKTNAAAVFPMEGPRAGMKAPGCTSKSRRAGCGSAAGCTRRSRPHLVKVREHIVDTWPEIRKITKSKAFVSRVGTLHGDRLTRVPRGFPADHPAAESSSTASSSPATSSRPTWRSQTTSTRRSSRRSRRSCRWSGF